MSLISIILPTYNVEKYIARALESCINQTLKDIEIIVVDDKGSDKSIDVAYEYAAKDKRIKIIHNKENLKLLHARAEGVKVATSELIMFLDPDDELELNACEVAFNNFDGNYDALRFGYTLIGFGERFGLGHPKNYEDFKNRTKNLEYFDFLMWDMIIKKECYLKCLKFIYEFELNQINLAEDVAFNFLVNSLSNGYKKIDDKLYKYYKNETSMTNANNDLNYVNTYEKILEFFKNIKDIYSDIFDNELYYIHYYLLTNRRFDRLRNYYKQKYGKYNPVYILKKFKIKYQKHLLKRNKQKYLKDKIQG